MAIITFTNHADLSWKAWCNYSTIVLDFMCLAHWMKTPKASSTKFAQLRARLVVRFHSPPATQTTIITMASPLWGGAWRPITPAFKQVCLQLGVQYPVKQFVEDFSSTNMGPGSALDFGWQLRDSSYIDLFGALNGRGQASKIFPWKQLQCLHSLHAPRAEPYLWQHHMGHPRTAAFWKRLCRLFQAKILCWKLLENMRWSSPALWELWGPENKASSTLWTLSAATWTRLVAAELRSESGKPWKTPWQREKKPLATLLVLLAPSFFWGRLLFIF